MRNATCNRSGAPAAPSGATWAISKRTSTTPIRRINLTAKKGGDASITIQFGACDGKIANCLQIKKGWNYTVRLYRLWRGSPERRLKISRCAAGAMTRPPAV